MATEIDETADDLTQYESLIRANPLAAVTQLRGILKTDPLNARAYRLLIEALEATIGKPSSQAEVRSTFVSSSTARLMKADQSLRTGDLPTAEIILRERLLEKPNDAEALSLLGRLAIMIDRDSEAEGLIRLAIELGLSSPLAQLDLAAALHRLNRPEGALDLLDDLIRSNPRFLPALNLRAAALARAGRIDESASAYQDSLQASPGQSRVWMHFGHLLKTMGRQQESIDAIRRALELAPTLGEAWWSLSDLKTFKFDLADIEKMQGALASTEISDEDRIHLHFALGKAQEDIGDPPSAFTHYSNGNRLRRQSIDYDPKRLTAFVRHAEARCTKSFFDERKDSGSPQPDPIFILGMPRAGSTLVEQILASHPQIEGTMELPEMLELADSLGNGLDYIDSLAKLTTAQLSGLGQGYIERTRRYRKTARPFFTDKMPNNWMNIPLIQLILPNARIIDARRHPVACCLSNFKQHFVGGQPFSFDLSDLGRYYADYAAFMRHIDEVLPGKVHRISHEELVNDPEREIRRLLDHLNLPYDEACLRFHENKRIVRSASSEQVRRPINREGIDQWKAFEQWLGPLKDALGAELA